MIPDFTLSTSRTLPKGQSHRQVSRLSSVGVTSGRKCGSADCKASIYASNDHNAKLRQVWDVFEIHPKPGAQQADVSRVIYAFIVAMAKTGGDSPMAVRQESGYDSQSAATDDLSLNDTDDAFDENAKWEMDHILHEGEVSELDDEGNVMHVPTYLVKWTGYSYYSATWERQEQFEDSKSVLHDWQARQMKRLRGATGADLDFEYDEWDDEMTQLQERRERRHAGRNKKRRTLGESGNSGARQITSFRL